MNCPRFRVKRLNKLDYLHLQAEKCDGILAEWFIVAHLNTSGMLCPECGEKGCIGLAGGSGTGVSSAFRDAICVNCQSKDVTTLFEIKVRNNFV